jgi:hypothetical protein
MRHRHRDAVFGILTPGVAVPGENWQVNLSNTLIILALFSSIVLV